MKKKELFDIKTICQCNLLISMFYIKIPFIKPDKICKNQIQKTTLRICFSYSTDKKFSKSI